MEFISSDTNIWIDYMVIDKLDLPFKLPVIYLMNQDAIDDELLSPKGMREELLRLGLQPTELNENEFYYGLHMAETHPRLSEYDCSALAIAKCRGVVLMTGDSVLRKVALSEGVSVTGTIGLLDKLYEYEKIALKEYRECLILLIKNNGREVRLPMAELKNRLDKIDGDSNNSIKEGLA